jgi:hypothetical protein
MILEFVTVEQVDTYIIFKDGPFDVQEISEDNTVGNGRTVTRKVGSLKCNVIQLDGSN